jgi:hypothetical protein
MSPALAMHSTATVEHGSPHEVVALARHVLGGVIECDPFSNHYWNRFVVKAQVFCDEETNALSPAHRWTRHVTDEFIALPRFQTYFINPPGGLVKEAWRFACARWCEGSSVFWTGFSLEQMVYLGRLGFMWPGFRRVIPPRRLCFLSRVGDDAPPVSAKSPTHGNVLLLMPQEPEQVERFEGAARLMPSEVF